MENKAIPMFNNKAMVILAVALPKWDPVTPSLSLLLRQQQRIWRFLLARCETEQKFNQILPNPQKQPSQKLFLQHPFIFFSFFFQGKKKEPKNKRKKSCAYSYSPALSL